MNSFCAGLPQHNDKSPKTLLTTFDVAGIFGVHPSTVRRWCRQGKIRAYRTGLRGARSFNRENVAIAYLDRSIRYCLNM